MTTFDQTPDPIAAIREMLEKARPDQILRLLAEIHKSEPRQ